MSTKLNQVLLFSVLFIAICTKSAFSQIDSAAIVILDSMSSVVTDLESCSFTLKTEYDIYDQRLGLIKHSDIAKVNLKAPNKFSVKREGDKGHKEFYYDGKSVYYYSADNNQYSSVSAPGTIMETIDSIQNQYGVEFPASDIFYEDLVDDLLDNSDNIAYLGKTNIDNKECFHVAGTNAELSYQIWIASDGSFFPVKMAIVYKLRPGMPQYEASFNDWVINPALEDSMFDFVIPQGAVKIKILKKNK